jgi:Domain of unknown function (DUF4190)
MPLTILETKAPETMSDQIKFSCLACGQHIVCDASESGRSMLCPSCNANLTVPHQMLQEPEPSVSEPEAPASLVSPPPVPAASRPAPSRTSGLAIASLVCSLLSPVTCIGWLPGIICGHLAKARIRRDPSLEGNGLATAGLIIGYATFIFGIALIAASFIWPAAMTVMMTKRIEHQFDQLATNPAIYTQIQSQSETNSNTDEPMNSSDPGNSGGSGWTMDVKDAQIPDSPVSGQIHGQDFQFKRALLRNGNLKFTSANGSKYVIIHGLGMDIANKSFEMDTNTISNTLKVEISWDDNGHASTQTFDSFYAMELKFDAAQKRKIPGRIYLCLPDDSKTYIAGTFTITVPKPKPSPATQ